MTRLNIGCGDKSKSGFINIDTRQLPGVDLCIDLKDITNHFQPDEVEEILADDVIEHFGHREVDGLLKDLFTILKQTGVLRIRVPDADYHIEQYRIGRYDADLLSYWLFGGQDYPENFHKMCFSYGSLRNRLQRAGFTKFSDKINAGINFKIEAYK